MKTERIGYLLVLLVAVFVVSSAALSAQNPSDDAPGKAPVKPWTSDRHQRLRG